ncbi:MAG: dynamin family protein, partial [Planctomycetes bacterium]|nr:dynamin family protein [Planctomycetota bacterium]
MKQPWLDEEFLEVIDELKSRMLELEPYLSDSEIETDTVKQLTDIILNLDELFLLVIVGEVKSGKSSMINALFGEKICPEGVIPVTDRINVLKYSEKPMEKYTGDFMVERFLSFDKLRNMNIVDTPGTNSIIKQHQDITENFIPRSDLVMFCTSVDRPYTQTEKDFLSLIAKEWRKRVFFLLTKIDIKDTEEEINEVINYIQTNVQNDFNFRPLIFPCSPKLAFDSKITDDPEMFEKSRFKAVEDYIFETLSERDKLQLKLVNPIVSSLRICENTLEEFKTRMIIIEDHSKTIEDVRRIVKNQADGILEGYSRYILEISNLLTSLLNLSVSFLEEKIILRNYPNFKDRHKFKLEFNEIVQKKFEKKLCEIIQRATD